MTVLALIGGQWGEEGKGKLTELLGENAKVVVRYSGGGNLHQPVQNQFGTFSLNYIPRSIFNSKTISVLGAGMVIDPKKLVEEMKALREKGLDMRRFYISEQAHVVMPYHPLLEEAERKAYGTPVVDAAGSGLGPAYADKINRVGIRMGDLLQEEQFLSRLSKTLLVKNEILTKVYQMPALTLQKVYHEYLAYGRELRDHIFDTRLILQRAMESGHRILLESDQGSMLDMDFGAYPYVSNVAPTVGAASSSSGVPPSSITGVVGVFGAYISRSQGGPFPTEMAKEESAPLMRLRTMEHLVQNNRNGNHTIPPANETTRRFGWFDTVAARFVSQINGLTSIALTNLDGLDSFDTIKICTEYQVHDAALTRFPADLATLRAVRPVYQEVPGWKTSTARISSFAELPPACQNFLLRLQGLIGTRIDIITTGPERRDTIMMRDPFTIAAARSATTPQPA
jgi:adenylosuccinate synthase